MKSIVDKIKIFVYLLFILRKSKSFSSIFKTTLYIDLIYDFIIFIKKNEQKYP